MTQNKFLELLSKNCPILSDGAMGTLLHIKGISFDECFDVLNLTNPALVADVHREYIDAGSQLIQTNTFGANRYKLSKHGLEDKVSEINKAGVELAKRIILASFKNILIAGDVGPLGVRLAPFGKVQPAEGLRVFEEQITALTEAGCDLIIIETLTDLLEIQLAIQAAKEVAPGLPIVASMTFTRDDRTLLGDNPGKVACGIKEAGADIIGVNCSGGANQILRILRAMRQAIPDGKFSVMPNAGWPEQVSGRIMYPAGPEYFGDYAVSFWQSGACLIGGCCGTTPNHIRAMKHAIENAVTSKDIEIISTNISEEEIISDELPTALAQKFANKRFVIAVEMDPPRGLSTHKLLAGASLLADSGADVINVADSPMARMRMSPWAVCDLIQRKIGIETVLHFPTRGRNLLRLQGDILAAHAINIRNIFIVMGDPTSIGDYPDAMDNYDLMPSGLIKLIKQGFNLGMDHSGSDIGQPTTFFVGCALNLNPSNIKTEFSNFRKKLEAGADFVLTQPVYEPEVARKFFDAYQQEYGYFPIPILAGILPLVNARHANFLHHEIPGISIPDHILSKMEAAGENAHLVGIEIAMDLIDNIHNFVNGFYIMPALNRFELSAEIIEKSKQKYCNVYQK